MESICSTRSLAARLIKEVLNTERLKTSAFVNMLTVKQVNVVSFLFSILTLATYLLMMIISTIDHFLTIVLVFQGMGTKWLDITSCQKLFLTGVRLQELLVARLAIQGRLPVQQYYTRNGFLIS